MRPVGLFGVLTITARVRGPIADAIASRSRSWSSARTGTLTGTTSAASSIGS